MKTVLRHYPIPIILTIIVWLLIGYYIGLAAFITVVLLTFLEISLSVDNAVINSRVLDTMSRFWQRLFMTVGIFIAVFVIRFALPIVIVAVSASLGFGEVLGLAVNHPIEYGEKLHQAIPLINAFGGIFLVMVGLYFFINNQRHQYWLVVPERILAQAAALPFIKPIVVLCIGVAVYLGVAESQRVVVSIAMGVAFVTYLLLHSVTFLMEKWGNKNVTLHKTGMQAFIALLYLEVLDASFSLDGVIGAFAITDNIFIIMAGLGVGAIWVRSMTLHLVKSRALLRYQYLESGAHWAILFLGSIMLIKLFGIEPPEWLIGVVGIVTISLAVFASRKNKAQVSNS